METLSPNHWTTREVPKLWLFPPCRRCHQRVLSPGDMWSTSTHVSTGLLCGGETKNRLEARQEAQWGATVVGASLAVEWEDGRLWICSESWTTRICGGKRLRNVYSFTKITQLGSGKSQGWAPGLSSVETWTVFNLLVAFAIKRVDWIRWSLNVPFSTRVLNLTVLCFEDRALKSVSIVCRPRVHRQWLSKGILRNLFFGRVSACMVPRQPFWVCFFSGSSQEL